MGDFPSHGRGSDGGEFAPGMVGPGFDGRFASLDDLGIGHGSLRTLLQQFVGQQTICMEYLERAVEMHANVNLP